MPDMSGWNLQPGDPWYNFYNPQLGQYYGDDRNNPSLNPGLMTGPTGYQPNATPFNPVDAGYGAGGLNSFNLLGGTNYAPPPPPDNTLQPQGAPGDVFTTGGPRPGSDPNQTTGGPPPGYAPPPQPGAPPPPAGVTPPAGGPSTGQSPYANPVYHPPTSDGNDPNTGLTNTYDENGNVTSSSIPNIDLGAPQMVPGQFQQGTLDDYTRFMNQIGGQIQDQYKQPIPQFDPAQMNLGGVPQPGAQQMGISPELQAQLSGRGYDPATYAGMRAGAIEDASNAGRSELSQGKIAAQQAGLGASPAGGAIASDIARRTGAAQNSALRDLAIANAKQGNENQQFGIGQQTAIGTSNMAQANAMALANANRMFDAMTQNMANQQDANKTKFGAAETRNLNQSNAVAGFLSGEGNTLNTSRLGKAASADEANTANINNWSLNQAQLNRGAQTANLNAGENRWTVGMGGFGGPNPASYGQPGTGFSPIGSVLSGTGNAIIDSLTKQKVTA